MKQGAKFKGVYDFTVKDKEGKIISHTRAENIVTDQGLNALLDIMFHASTQISTWYLILFETDTTPAAGTTYATPVFTECTAYDEATRPAFVEAAASGKSITNSANKATFTFSDTKLYMVQVLLVVEQQPQQKGTQMAEAHYFQQQNFQPQIQLLTVMWELSAILKPQQTHSRCEL